MKVFISDISALNPHTLRFNVYTYDGDIETADESKFKYYELAIVISDFTDTGTEGNIEVSGDRLQQVISEKIVAAQNVSTLANYVKSLNLNWELNLTPKSEPTTPDGLKLALAE